MLAIRQSPRVTQERHKLLLVGEMSSSPKHALLAFKENRVGSPVR
jgi:hypothetical protein